MNNIVSEETLKQLINELAGKMHIDPPDHIVAVGKDKHFDSLLARMDTGPSLADVRSNADFITPSLKSISAFGQEELETKISAALGDMQEKRICLERFRLLAQEVANDMGQEVPKVYYCEKTHNRHSLNEDAYVSVKVVSTNKAFTAILETNLQTLNNFSDDALKENIRSAILSTDKERKKSELEDLQELTGLGRKDFDITRKAKLMGTGSGLAAAFGVFELVKIASAAGLHMAGVHSDAAITIVETTGSVIAGGATMAPVGFRASLQSAKHTLKRKTHKVDSEHAANWPQGHVKLLTEIQELEEQLSHIDSPQAKGVLARIKQIYSKKENVQLAEETIRPPSAVSRIGRVKRDFGIQ